MQKLVEFFIKYGRITFWMMMLILIAGIAALFTLEKRKDPKMELEQISISIPFPGASAIEVEEGIITKIEENLRGLEGIMKVTSTSTDSWGGVDIEVEPGYDMNKMLSDVKNSVNSISSYPTAAEKPIITQDVMWNRAIMMNIYGPEDHFTLKKIVEEFRDELLKTGKISNVNMWGIPSREISIEISPENLIRYKLNIDDIASAIRNSNLNISSGSVVTNQEEILIRSYSKKYEASEFENIEVVSSINGAKIKLIDVCSVEEKWPENIIWAEQGNKRAIAFNVMYNNTEDIIEIDQITMDMAEKFEKKYEGQVEFKPFIREVDDLTERLELMELNGIIGLALVLVVLGVFLNIRIAFWVALGIPISLGGMLFVLDVVGITINEMSLFGMIMVIGILVDDGIIIGESIYTQYQRYGKKSIQAAIDGTLEVLTPVVVSILTTIVAFVPYFYFYGMLGKHIWQIAAVVIIALLFSLIEAILILPAHLAHSKGTEGKEIDIDFFKRLRKRIDAGIDYVIFKVYKPLLALSLQFRYVIATMVFVTILIVVALFEGQHIRAQMFPAIEPPFTRIQVDVVAGTSADVVDGLRDEIISRALKFADEFEDSSKGILYPIENYTSWRNGNTINIFFILPSSADRDYTIGEFSYQLGEYIGEFPEAENVRVGGWQFGGSPINVRFLSHDYTQLLKAKDLLKEELSQIEGISDIQDNTPIGNKEFVVELKPKGKAMGFTISNLTRQLRQGFYGQEVMRFQRGRDELKIWVRFDKANRVSVSQIENLKVQTPTGEYVPFKEVATYEMQRSVRRIRHDDGERAVAVWADLDFEKNDQATVLTELDQVIVPKILSQVEGVKRAYGGQQEEVAKMQNSMVVSMSIAMIVMFTILIFLLKSFMQTSLVMSLIPLGIIGAVIGHWLLGIPVSILSFLGIVALAGIIVNDSVVLVDKYNKELSKGVNVIEALLSAGSLRFRPILLTTITTSVGLAPMIFLTSEQGQFLVPMAASVAFGLIFGTFITLVVLPSTLYIINDIRLLNEKVLSFFSDRKPKSRLELEQAYQKSDLAEQNK